MTLQEFLKSLKLRDLPADYPWESVHFNGFWAATDEDNPRLMDSLLLISVKAAFALGVGCAEWVVARLEGHIDTTDARLRIEAGWAAAIDPRYANLPEPEPPPDAAPRKFASPLFLSMKLLSYAHELLTGDGEGVRSNTLGQALLVDHITAQHPAFSSWLSESLRKCGSQFPASDVPVEEEPPVPRDLFNPGFVWSDDVAARSLQQFVDSLDPARNPYLRTPEEMRARGFTGLPGAPSSQA
jgi:hypothetical protein